MWRRLMAFAEDIEDRIQCALLRRATSAEGHREIFRMQLGRLGARYAQFFSTLGSLGREKLNAEIFSRDLIFLQYYTIDDEDEQAQRQQGCLQGQQQRRDQCRSETGKLYRVHQVRHGQQHQRVNQPGNQ